MIEAIKVVVYGGEKGYQITDQNQFMINKDFNVLNGEWEGRVEEEEGVRYLLVHTTGEKVNLENKLDLNLIIQYVSDKEIRLKEVEKEIEQLEHEAYVLENEIHYEKYGYYFNNSYCDKYV